MRRWLGIGMVLLLGLGALVAVFSTARSRSSLEGAKSDATGGSSVRTRAGEAGVPASNAKQALTASDGIARSAAPSSVTSSAVGPVVAPVASNRVVKHATVDVRVRAKHLGVQFAKAQALAGFLGGYVEQSDQARGLASITMRVPVARFDEAVARLGGLGRVTDRSERGDDVSAQFSDLEARLRNLSAQEGVLQDLMRQARSIPDTITVQQQLSQVRGEIEQLTGQRNLLDNQSSLATVSATLHARGVVPARSHEHRSTIGQAWHDAVGVAVSILGGTIVVLGALVPLGVLGALVAGGWMIVRRRRPTLDPAGV